MKKQKKLKLLTYLVIASVCYFGYTLYTLQISIDEKEFKNQELQKNINIETAKKQQLLKQKSIINTDEFYEQMAREKLGYIKDNEKIYITKRIDRKKEGKNNISLSMEDFAQLNRKLESEKYNGSYEAVAKTIDKYSSYPILDKNIFLKIIIF